MRRIHWSELKITHIFHCYCQQSALCSVSFYKECVDSDRFLVTTTLTIRYSSSLKHIVQINVKGLNILMPVLYLVINEFIFFFSGVNVTSEDAAYFATLFDVGGIVGGIVAGIASDRSGRPATACAIMVILAIPAMWSYNYYGQQCPFNPEESNGCYGGHIALLMVSGLLVNGPYALITTAVSAELGTHKSLKGSSKALATVTSIVRHRRTVRV